MPNSLQDASPKDLYCKNVNRLLKLAINPDRSNINSCIFDNNSEQLVCLERKTCEIPRSLNDGNISQKHHIDYISTKISKEIGLIVRLRHLFFSLVLGHLVPFFFLFFFFFWHLVSSLGAWWSFYKSRFFVFYCTS